MKQAAFLRQSRPGDTGSSLRYVSLHMRRCKLTPEQEREVYRQAKAGTPYAAIQAWLASQGVTLAKSSISEIIPRVERRALAQRPAAFPEVHIDPRTGALVEVTDDMVLGHIQRIMMADCLEADSSPYLRLSAARIALRIMGTQRKLGAPIAAQRR